MTFEEKQRQLSMLKVEFASEGRRVNWLMDELEKAWAALEEIDDDIPCGHGSIARRALND